MKTKLIHSLGFPLRLVLFLGGPLLTLRGQVISVNSAIMSQSGGFEGIGFAIPSNMAVHVAKALIAHGKVERGWLGVSIQEVTPDLAKSFGLANSEGALIADVMKVDRARTKLASKEGMWYWYIGTKRCRMSPRFGTK